MCSPLPKAIDEQDLCVPSQRGLAANTCRRNFTDAQETAQWLGGVEVPTRLLESLLTQGQKLNNKAVVVSTTSYDGQLELACWKMGIPCMSFTDSGTNQKYAAGVVGGRAAAGDCALMRPVFAYQFSLVQDWKNGSGIMGQQLPRYVPNPPEADRPIPAVMPTLAICVVSDNSLTVPPPIRQEFLTDPTRAPEWRTFLKRFDKMYGTPASFAPAAAAIPVEESSFNWERAFQDDVKLEKDLKECGTLLPYRAHDCNLQDYRRAQTLRVCRGEGCGIGQCQAHLVPRPGPLVD